MAGPQCCTPGPGAEHCCVGKEETCGPFLSYITSHHTPTAAVVLVNDIFGFDAPLLRKLADKMASAGYYVVVPDFFNKDPFVPANTGNPFATLGDWIKNHQALDSVEGAKQVIECLHKKSFSSSGAVGFCWGAKVVVQLAKGDCLKAAVLAHPSLVTVEDIQDVKTPIAILAAEHDTTTPPDLAQKFIDTLKSKSELESFAHIYPGVAHGWTCRYNPDDPKEVANAEEAHTKMLEWFGKFLH
ncbi:hypothetical protein L7F22_025027 [Adiantum nelumboides]|nr:hypothetical protein [Adiantum nelumboides]